MPVSTPAAPNHLWPDPKLAEKLARLKEVFAIATLARLDAAGGQLDACGDESRAAIRDHVFPAFHDIKGQGASFGFPELSDIGEAVCAAIRQERTATVEMKVALCAIIGEVRRVIDNRNAATHSSDANEAAAKCKETLQNAVNGATAQRDATYGIGIKS